MATGAEHYRTAEQLLDQIVRKGTTGPIVAEGPDVPDIIAAAQAHATLALAAATALSHSADMPRRECEAWEGFAVQPFGKGGDPE